MPAVGVRWTYQFEWPTGRRWTATDLWVERYAFSGAIVAGVDQVVDTDVQIAPTPVLLAPNGSPIGVPQGAPQTSVRTQRPFRYNDVRYTVAQMLSRYGLGPYRQQASRLKSAFPWLFQ